MSIQALRRSIKSEKSDSKHQHHISISQKDAIAIIPPKKVIRALYDYEANPAHPQELSFARGDFFHVIGREHDTEWYEACNPSMPNARGLVPVEYFQVLGKNERDSASSITSSASHRLPDNDSGYSDRSGGSGVTSAPPPQDVNSRPIRFSKSVGKGSGAMVYGIIMYDFKAERADELDAKAGEAIIVIAQSNPEWFVAKPIGRLGGPGLIPVSFIEIRDMVTGQAVPNAQEAVQRAGVPKVEEWKKMAADYKNSSIALGKFESGGGQPAPSTMHDADTSSLTPTGPGYQNGHGNGEYASHPHQAPRSNALSTQFSQSRPSSSQMPYPVAATIPRWRFGNDRYWYIIDAVMQDGSQWQLSRLYSDFYDFQIALLTEFPEEAGNTGKPRTLPFMPGPVTYVTDVISNGRQQNLDEYIQKMLKMPPHISRCHLIRQLFAPRDGDVELHRDASMDPFHRLSDVSRPSSGESPGHGSQQSSRVNLNGNGYPAQPTHQAYGSNGMTSNALFRPPELDRQASSLTQGSTGSQALSDTILLKFHFYRDPNARKDQPDDTRKIMVSQGISFAELKETMQHRLQITKDISIRYMDDQRNDVEYDIRNDHDVTQAIQQNPKLVLYVYSSL
ncbi:MAG: bud emergence protein 1 [Thelocarpon superellum]|nr:MAG: bud emergence protein 1 [Thelocarpon superellum]